MPAASEVRLPSLRRPHATPPGRGQPWRNFGLTSAVVFMVSFDATVVVAAFPALRLHFAGASATELSWTLNAYTIVYAALLVAGGRLADRYGNKRCFLQGLFVFTLASGLCALAPNAAWLAAARVGQAAGAALLTPTSLALLLADFPSAARQKAVSLWTAVGAVAAALGPALGSALIEWVDWRMIFLINVPVGVLVWWRGQRQLAETVGEEDVAPFDWAGTARLIVGLGTLAHGIVLAGETGWSSWATRSAILGGLGLLGWFVWRARQRPDGALDLRLFEDPNFRWASVGTLIFGAAFSLMFFTFYLFMTGVWHYSQSLAGWTATLGPVVVIVVIVSTSGLTAKVGHRPVLVLGGLLFAASNAWYFHQLGSAPDYLRTWLPGQIVSAVGIGLLLPTLTGASVAHLPRHRLAVGNAAQSALRQMGGALGVALGVSLVGGVGAGLARFQAVYTVLGCAGLLLALVGLGIGRRRESGLRAEG